MARLGLAVDYQLGGDIGIELGQPRVDGTGLCGAVCHHHGADALVAQGDLAFQVVINDVVAQGIHVALVRVYLLHVNELLYLFEVAQNLLHLQAKLDLHGLA